VESGSGTTSPFDLPFRVSARADYAVRALAEMAADGGGPVTALRISQAQEIPIRFLRNILDELRRAGLVGSHRGPLAGYLLTRPAQLITLEQIIHAVAGELSSVHGTSLDELAYPGAAAPLRDVWLAVRSSLTAVLASVTVADLASGSLPAVVRELAVRPGPAAPGASP
jgi:Rrf2 family protein